MENGPVLTNDQLEAIRKIVREQLGVDAQKERSPSWKPKTVISAPQSGLEIAGEDYIDGYKGFFTWDEAIGLAEKVGDGWRLPTMAEWTKLCLEFGETNDGNFDAEEISDALELGVDDAWWSSTVYGANSSYRLRLNGLGSTKYINPQNRSGKGNHLSVRFVRPLKDAENK